MCVNCCTDDDWIEFSIALFFKDSPSHKQTLRMKTGCGKVLVEGGGVTFPLRFGIMEEHWFLH